MVNRKNLGLNLFLLFTPHKKVISSEGDISEWDDEKMRK